jgi:type I restriction enzyme M protein
VAKQSAKVQSLSAFAWSIADILRGDFKQSEYGKVILPFAVLRRLDCLLQETTQALLEAATTLPAGVAEAKPVSRVLERVG